MSSLVGTRSACRAGCRSPRQDGRRGPASCRKGDGWGPPRARELGSHLLLITRRSDAVGFALCGGEVASLECGEPGADAPVDRLDIPGEPAPWLHRHPSEQRFHGYYGPVRRRAPRRYSMPSVSASARSLRDLEGLRPRTQHRRSPSHVPCKSRRLGSRRLYAGHHLASNTGIRQAHPGGRVRTPGFDAI